MIDATRIPAPRKVRGKRSQGTHTVWSEPSPKGGYIIYAGIRGTDVKTYAGMAMSPTTLEYGIRKAKVKFNLPVD